MESLYAEAGTATAEAAEAVELVRQRSTELEEDFSLLSNGIV
jgi:hypothetical protein